MKLLNTFVLALLVAPLALGCDDAEGGEGPKKEVLPDIQVTLPPAPDFDEARAPIKWEDDPDGAYSIFGLRKDVDENVKKGEDGNKVIVKGWVQEIYVAPTCEEGQLCPPGKKPHFWITDHENEKGKKRAMMVTDYDFPIPDWDEATLEMWAEQPRVVVEVGKNYTIKGEFKRVSDSGFAHDNGLLQFHSYKAPNPDPESNGEMIWIFPPNCDWHPLAEAAAAAENADLQARMQKDAEALKAAKEGGG